jgi:hypothetical protein
VSLCGGFKVSCVLLVIIASLSNEPKLVPVPQMIEIFDGVSGVD